MDVPISNRRWLDDAPMTDDEVRRYVRGTRLTQSGNVFNDTRSISEKISDMERESRKGYANATKIVTELKKLQQEQIAKAELDKQRAATLRQGLASKGVEPDLAGKIGELAGLPKTKVVPRILGGKRKTHKGKKSKRKTHKRK